MGPTEVGMVSKSLIPADRIEKTIILVRQKVRHNAALAALSGVETRALSTVNGTWSDSRMTPCSSLLARSLPS